MYVAYCISDVIVLVAPCYNMFFSFWFINGPTILHMSSDRCMGCTVHTSYHAHKMSLMEHFNIASSM